MNDFFPCPSKALLRGAFVGKRLRDVPAPAAILDRAIVKDHCDRMLKACQSLGVAFRPHVKTHKTAEITQLQVGENAHEVNIIVSTVAEAETLSDYLSQCKGRGDTVNILYGIPLPPSQVERLGQLGKRLGKGSISALIDNISQLQSLRDFKDISGFDCELYIKIDTGYGRAGLTTDSPNFKKLVKIILNETEPSGYGKLSGFYSHAGNSYGSNSAAAAMSLLVQELEGLRTAADLATSMGQVKTRHTLYILSVGATPTATSIQNLLTKRVEGKGNIMDEQLTKLQHCIEDTKRMHTIEIHAGVYPILDMQQVSTYASPPIKVNSHTETQPKLSTADIALTMLAEVASVYEDRESPEALIAAGSLALGREPCKSYNGWGIVSDWDMAFPTSTGRSGWQVGRISQEHGILTKDSSADHDPDVLSVTRIPSTGDLRPGQKIRIFPNHACIAGAGFGWYLVVDSSLPEDRQDEVVDVWVRSRGW